MTKKDFFILVIKLFGLYSLILSAFRFLPSTISSLGIGGSMAFSLIVMSFLIFLFVILMFWLLIKKAPIIVEKLNLAKGFEDDRIELSNLESLSILKIAVILIGGMFFIDNLPNLLSECYRMFMQIGAEKGLIKNPPVYQQMYRVDYFNLAIIVMNLIIGYLLISNYKWIAEKFTKSENSSTEE